MKLENCRFLHVAGNPDINRQTINRLECIWNEGFYSNQSQVLNSLIILSNHGIIADQISYEHGFNVYKNKNYSLDIYPIFHNMDISYQIPIFSSTNWLSYNNYNPVEYNFEILNNYLNRYFKPSLYIKAKMYFLKQKYNINTEKTISVCYRGTDKDREVKLADPHDYLQITKKLLNENPDYKVLLQTDQTQVINYFRDILKEKLVYFIETPSTETKSPIWAIYRDNDQDSLEWAQWFDAAIRIVSQCKFLVNHTGNTGMFINLYRGHNKNIYQFDQFGVLRHD